MSKADDEAAFAEFVAARTPALSRTAYLLTADHHLAEDLLQTALFQAARNWDRIETNPEMYVRRTMYHQNISWWRRRKAVETTIGSYDAPAEVRDTDLRLSVQAALAQLTLKQRTMLVLRYFEDLTEAQTAEALGVRVGTVKSVTSQALRRLRVLAPELSDLIGAGDAS